MANLLSAGGTALRLIQTLRRSWALAAESPALPGQAPLLPRANDPDWARAQWLLFTLYKDRVTLFMGYTQNSSCNAGWENKGAKAQAKFPLLPIARTPRLI